MDFMIPYGVLFVFCQILAEIRAKLFLEKPITYRPAESLRCLPVFAVRRGCVVRIAYESFLDYSLQEFFMFLEWRAAIFRFSLRFQFHLIHTSVKGDSLSPLTISLRRAEPARPQFACGMVILPVLYNLVWVYQVESALRLLPSKMFR